MRVNHICEASITNGPDRDSCAIAIRQMMQEGVMTDEQEREPGRVEMNIKDLIPVTWQGQQVWVSTYRAYGVPQNKLLLARTPSSCLT